MKISFAQKRTWKAVPILATFLLCNFVTSLAAQEDVEPKWDVVEGWDIRIDRTLDYGCFMATVFEGGSVFRFGWDRTSEMAYLMIGDTDWQSIEAGKKYDVEIQFDDLAAWSGTATGRRMGDLPMLYVVVDKSNFLVEMAERHTVKLIYQGDEILRLSLEGSYAAIEELVKCQIAVNETQDRKSEDPFSSNNEDPFSS